MTHTSSFYPDLTFTSNSSLTPELGIEKYLYTDSCHHSIVLGKMNANVPLSLIHEHVKFVTIIKLTEKIFREV